MPTLIRRSSPGCTDARRLNITISQNNTVVALELFDLWVAPE